MSYTGFDFPHTHFYDDDLRELIKKMENVWNRVNTLDNWKERHELEYNELKRLYDAIVSGNFPPSMLAEMTEWFEKNAVSLVGEMVRFISVGINDNGYFFINIPSNWRDIMFNTTELDIFTPLQSEYGHLVISY